MRCELNGLRVVLTLLERESFLCINFISATAVEQLILDAFKWKWFKIVQ